MQRIKQLYYPEGYFSNIRLDNVENKTHIDDLVGTPTVVSGKVIAYVASSTNNGDGYLQVDLGENRLGILPVNEKSEIYKNKSLVNEVINFCIVSIQDDNTYLLERDALIKRAKKQITLLYKPGDVIIGKVVSFLGYGVMIDIGWGVTGFLHKTDIHGSPSHPKEVLKNISYLEVEIKDITADGNIYLRMV